MLQHHTWRLLALIGISCRFLSQEQLLAQTPQIAEQSPSSKQSISPEQEAQAAPQLREVRIRSTLDGSLQPCLVYLPETDEKPVPLLVFLHSWSGNYRQKGNIEVALQECHQRGWGLLHPDFRGPNWTPDACGSDLARQDILDAVAWAREQRAIDPDRIYLSGFSGGGHMSMLMAGRHPELWGGVSAWVGISDLVAWHVENTVAERKYAQDIEKVVGGAPGASPEVDAQLHDRSPLTWLAAARGVTIDLNAGIHDGHTGSVPISHTLHAFNVLAQVNDAAEQSFSPEQIELLTRGRKVPPELSTTQVAEPRQKPVLLQRTAGAARVTLFEGGHEGDVRAAIHWLSQQSKAASP